MKKHFIILFLLLILASCSNNVQKMNINEEESQEISIKQNINSSLYKEEKGQKQINIPNESKKIKNTNIFEAKASGGTTDFLALNINFINFNDQNSKIDGILNENDLQKNKVQIILEANNHVYSYEDIDYLKNITLSGTNPENYKIIETKMGGHHVIVLLDFAFGTNIDELQFNDTPVGNISLVFNK